MLKSIYRSALVKLFLALCLVAAVGAAIPAFSAQRYRTTTEMLAVESLQSSTVITVDPTSFTIAEPTGSDTFNISLASEPTASVTIGLSTSNSQCDVPASSVTLDSTNWSAGVDVTVNAVDDDVDDGAQICTVITAEATSDDLIYDGENPDDVDVTVSDDDTAGITVSPTSFTIAEPTGSDTFNISLTSEPTDPVTIGLSTSNSQCDVPASSATLTSTNWSAGVDVTVNAVDDDVVDGAQTCTVITGAATSSDDVYNTMNADDVTVTVNDDDTAGITVSPTSLTIAEPTGSDTFNISLTSEPTDPVTIGLSTSNNQCDVPASSATLTSTNWSAGVDVTVNAVDDDVVDGAQTCTVITGAATSSDDVYNTMNAADVVVTVNDDDTTTVQFSNSSYTVGEAVGSADITVTLSNPSLSTVTVNFATSDGSATAGSDYTANSGTLTFSPNDTSETFSVSITNDGMDEPLETVNLTLSSPSNATLGSPNPATLSITDDDLPPEVQFSQNSYSVNENEGTAAIEVELSAPSAFVVTVEYATADNTATAGSDYTTVTDTLTFNPGETSKSFSVPILDDVNDEPDESVDLSLSSPVNASLGGRSTATLFIRDNDDPPTVQFSNSTYSVNEGDGSATITVTLSAASGRLITVDYATSPGSTNPATPGSDYTSQNGTLRFLAGQTSRTFTVPINDDALDELNESVNLSLSDASNASLGTPASSVLTIVDNDGQTTVQFSPATISVNENVVTATVNVVLSAPSGLQVSVDYATSDGTATAGSDYTATSGTLTFAPGETSKSFSVSILTDQIAEPDETINLALTNPVNAQLGAPNDTAVLTIVDANEAPTVLFSQSTYAIAESAVAATVTVTLSSASAFQVSVVYVTGDGTATVGEDYAMASGTLVFAPGEVSQSFTVPILSDELNESDETVALSLSNPQNAGLGVPANASLIILDDDPLPAVRFNAASLTVDENDGFANVVVSLDTASGRTVTVEYITVDGTALAGSDYSTTNGTLVFSPGETSKTISVPIVDDDIDEPDETFAVALSAPNNATLGATDNITVTIVNNGLPIFRSYYPVFLVNYAIGEPNDSCGSALEIMPSHAYYFLPDDRDDWYQFDLSETGNLVVEVSNFAPLLGQVAVYKGDSCASVTVLGNYGAPGISKIVDLGSQTAGHYYIYVSNDGAPNNTTPYQLHIRFP